MPILSLGVNLGDLASDEVQGLSSVQQGPRHLDVGQKCEELRVSPSVAAWAFVGQYVGSRS